MQILKHLKEAPEGLTKAEVVGKLDMRSLRADRIADLEASGWVAREGGKLVVAGLGRIIVAFYRAYRAALGLPLKGG